MEPTPPPSKVGERQLAAVRQEQFNGSPAMGARCGDGTGDQSGGPEGG